MKKIIFLVLLMTTQTLWADNVESLFRDFKKIHQAEYFHLSPVFLKCVQICADTEDIEVMKNIRSIRVLDMDDCKKADKMRFHKRVQNLDIHGYEPLVVTNQEGEQVKVLIKMSKQIISELLIVVSCPDDCQLVCIKGKFKESDLNALVNEDYNK